MLSILLISSILLWIVVSLNLLLSFAIIRRLPSAQLEQQGLEVGSFAPPFAASTLTGAEITLRSFAKTSVALLFISPTCGPCREILPELESLWPKAQKVGTEFLVVSLANAEKTKALIEEFNIGMTVVIALPEANTFGKDYKVSATPSYCIVDKQGRVQSAGILTPDGPWAKIAEEWGVSRPSHGNLILAPSE